MYPIGLLLLLSSARALSNCPRTELFRCFHNALIEVQVLKPTAQETNCQMYLSYLYCFNYGPNCTNDARAEIAAQEYSKMNGLLLPKHTFIALYGAVKERCAPPCSSEAEFQCRRRMDPEHQDSDQALYMELTGQARQIELRIISRREGCERFEQTLVRWIRFRSAMCPDLVTCSCEEQKISEAVRQCGIPCGEYFHNHSALPRAYGAQGGMRPVAALLALCSLYVL